MEQKNRKFYSARIYILVLTINYSVITTDHPNSGGLDSGEGTAHLKENNFNRSRTTKCKNSSNPSYFGCNNKKTGMDKFYKYRDQGASKEHPSTTGSSNTLNNSSTGDEDYLKSYKMTKFLFSHLQKKNEYLKQEKIENADTDKSINKSKSRKLKEEFQQEFGGKKTLFENKLGEYKGQIDMFYDELKDIMETLKENYDEYYRNDKQNIKSTEKHFEHFDIESIIKRSVEFDPKRDFFSVITTPRTYSNILKYNLKEPEYSKSSKNTNWLNIYTKEFTIRHRDESNKENEMRGVSLDEVSLSQLKEKILKPSDIDSIKKYSELILKCYEDIGKIDYNDYKENKTKSCKNYVKNIVKIKSLTDDVVYKPEYIEEIYNNKNFQGMNIYSFMAEIESRIEEIQKNDYVLKMDYVNYFEFDFINTYITNVITLSNACLAENSENKSDTSILEGIKELKRKFETLQKSFIEHYQKIANFNILLGKLKVILKKTIPKTNQKIEYNKLKPKTSVDLAMLAKPTSKSKYGNSFKRI